MSCIIADFIRECIHVVGALSYGPFGKEREWKGQEGVKGWSPFVSTFPNAQYLCWCVFLYCCFWVSFLTMFPTSILSH